MIETSPLWTGSDKMLDLSLPPSFFKRILCKLEVPFWLRKELELELELV